MIERRGRVILLPFGVPVTPDNGPSESRTVGDTKGFIRMTMVFRVST